MTPEQRLAELEERLRALAAEWEGHYCGQHRESPQQYECTACAGVHQKKVCAGQTRALLGEAAR